jgi:hypothetical protein
LNALRQKREREQKVREMLQEAITVQRPQAGYIDFLKETIKIQKQLKTRVEQDCLAYDDKLMQLTQYGRYISAFEMCEQKGEAKECIQRVREAKEKWRKACSNADVSLRIMYHTARLRAEEVKKTLEDLRNKVDACVRAGMGISTGLAALADREVCAFQSQLLSRWYPGSEFNLMTGTGRMVLPDGIFHYQGWIFIRGDLPQAEGLLIQVFDNRMNFAAGGYNIAVNLTPQGGWEIVEFNLPFDSQTEQILNTLSGRGVRLTNKEIIDLVNRYLHDTVWEVDLPLTFKKLLLEAAERRFFMESLLEYYAYDTYLRKVVADEARLKQQIQREQEREQKTEKTGAAKKGRGTKK